MQKNVTEWLRKNLPKACYLVHHKDDKKAFIPARHIEVPYKLESDHFAEYEYSNWAKRSTCIRHEITSQKVLVGNKRNLRSAGPPSVNYHVYVKRISNKEDSE